MKKGLMLNESVPKTLDDATSSYKLETGYLDANESKTFSLRLWMDENTPTSEEFMNKVFESKITIISSFQTDFDQEKPTTNIEVTNLSNKIKVDASNSIDNEKIKYYYYSLDGEHFEKTKESSYIFEVGNLKYGKGTETIKTLADSLNDEYTVYVKTEDEYGNQSEVVSQAFISGFVYDETKDNNLRYIGSNPNNYVSFNDELWRIIGIMNNIDDGNGTKETRIKLIRNEPIGNYSWDSSASSINGGYGINEWSQADTMKLMNPGHDSESIGGSLYWNRGIGTCYNGQNNTTTSCDFSYSGLKETAKILIGEAVWNTGANGTEISYNNILTSKFYELERSSNTGKICPGGDYCNDGVKRTTSWTGYIGLMYPSDYGYATSGGVTANRETCLNTVLYSWGGSGDCKANDWLYKSGTDQWTLSPLFASSHAGDVFRMYSSGSMSSSGACGDFALSPVLYLNSNVKIINGEGTESNPFVLEI